MLKDFAQIVCGVLTKEMSIQVVVGLFAKLADDFLKAFPSLATIIETETH